MQKNGRMERHNVSMIAETSLIFRIILQFECICMAPTSSTEMWVRNLFKTLIMAGTSTVFLISELRSWGPDVLLKKYENMCFGVHIALLRDARITDKN